MTVGALVQRVNGAVRKEEHDVLLVNIAMIVFTLSVAYLTPAPSAVVSWLGRRVALCLVLIGMPSDLARVTHG